MLRARLVSASRFYSLTLSSVLVAACGAGATDDEPERFREPPTTQTTGVASPANATGTSETSATSATGEESVAQEPAIAGDQTAAGPDTEQGASAVSPPPTDAMPTAASVPTQAQAPQTVDMQPPAADMKFVVYG